MRRNKGGPKAGIDRSLIITTASNNGVMASGCSGTTSNSWTIFCNTSFVLLGELEIGSDGAHS
jgi:hypothetical protein